MKLSEKTQEIGVNPGFPPAQVTVAFASPATDTPGMWPGHAHSCPRGCPGWGCSWLTSREQADTLLPRWPNLTTVLVVTHDSDTAPTDGNPSIRHLHPAGICSSGRPVVVQLLSGVWLFATPRAAALQASLSFTVSRSLLKLMSTEPLMVV